MPPLSAFVITYNEEDHIEACLESLSFCDEVVVVDSHSQDRTVELAKSHGAKVIERDWPGYREQKTFGLRQVQHDWVLNVDADERVSPELRQSIQTVLAAEPASDIAGFYVNRVVFHLGRWWRRGGWYPEYRLRLLRRSKVQWGGTDPHEKPIPHGRTERLAGELEHYSYRDLEDQFTRLQRFSSIAASEEFKRGRRVGVFAILFKPLFRFFKFYVIKQGFREGVAGLVVAISEGYYTFMKYSNLWDLYRRQGGNGRSR